MTGRARKGWLPAIAIAAAYLSIIVGVKAAGGAYAVDDAAVDVVGKCKIESFLSAARAPADRLGVVTPGCVAPVFDHRVEFTAAFSRTRASGEYGSGVTIKGKTPVPGLDFAVNDRFGVAFVAGVNYDLTADRYGTGFFSIPVSFRVAEPLVLLVNVGHSHDQFANLASSTWGAAFEFNLKPIGQEKLTFIGELFGHDRDTRKSAQLGLRITPVPQIDIDLIYGHRLTSDAGHWFTGGVNFRF
jgi:hypothetical protein